MVMYLIIPFEHWLWAKLSSRHFVCLRLINLHINSRHPCFTDSTRQVEVKSLPQIETMSEGRARTPILVTLLCCLFQRPAHPVASFYWWGNRFKVVSDSKLLAELKLDPWGLDPHPEPSNHTALTLTYREAVFRHRKKIQFANPSKED